MAGAGEITGLLAAIRNGDARAESRLLSLLYGELNRLAQQAIRREQAGRIVQPNSLVHEAYLRLMGTGPKNWNDRVHFCASASVVMRHVVVDIIRKRKADKRPDGKLRAELDEAMASVNPRIDEILIIDQALKRLAEWNPRQARLVEMRFFGGLTTTEAAEALGISENVAEHLWTAARAWLHAELDRKRSS